jgi:hypothetical protein
LTPRLYGSMPWLVLKQCDVQLFELKVSEQAHPWSSAVLHWVWQDIGVSAPHPEPSGSNQPLTMGGEAQRKGG